MSYRAFFSYARADDKIANWLHRQLDSYRTPKALIGVEGPLGPAPAKLHPIFRDRTDLQSGGHIDQSLQQALESSERLIVLCTPTSAKSHWVNHECETFLKLGREDRIFPVIAAGDPDSGDPETECFPPALRGKGLLAADLREIKRPTGQVIGDGRDGGRLKLIAGLLGVGLDQLARRERRRQRILVGWLSAAAVAFAALTVAAGGFAWLSEQRRAEAETQRNFAQVRLQDAQAAIKEFSNLLLRVDPQARLRRSVMHAFPGTDGEIACAADAACSGDAEAEAHDLASQLAFSTKDGSASAGVQPELAAQWRSLCGAVMQLAPTANGGEALSLHTDLCTGKIDFEASVGLAVLSDDLTVTHFSSPGYCGSGGCTDVFTLWRTGDRPIQPILACSGDAFAVRLVNGAPTTAYCMNRHSAGCADTGYYLYSAPYVPDLGGFVRGPSHYSSENSSDCAEDTTRVSINNPEDESYTPFELLLL